MHSFWHRVQLLCLHVRIQLRHLEVMREDERKTFAWHKAPLGLFAMYGFIVWLWVWGFHIPTPSKAAVVMAVVAGAMSLRGEIGGKEKLAWMLLLGGFLIVEFHALDIKDDADAQLRAAARASELAEFSQIAKQIGNTADEEKRNSQRTMAGVADSIKTQTGGNSFAFITFTAAPAQALQMRWNNFLAPTGEPYFVVYVTNHGKYPLRDAHAIMMDDERRLAAMQEYLKHPNGDWISTINSADTEYRMPYLRPQSAEAPQGEVDIIGLYPMPQSDSKRLTINFSSLNGYWNEILHLGRVNGTWHQCLSVMGPTVKQAKHPFVYCDSDWPQGKELAEKDWVITQPTK